MSGGVAYVLDETGGFEGLCNREMVDLEDVVENEDIEALYALLTEHAELTESTVAGRLLAEWPRSVDRFTKVMPRDYKRIMAERAARTLEQEQLAMELIHNG